MHRGAALLVVSLLLVHCGKDAGPHVEALDGKAVPLARLEQTFEGTMETARIPAISCAILNDGEIAYLRTFGVRSAVSEQPADVDTVFAAASFSKTVFAYLVMLLVEDQEIYLDTPVETFLGSRLADDPHYADLAGDFRTTLITGRQALSHTIGFPNWRFLTDDGRLRLLAEPGARFGYSGEGISLLQHVVETRTGRDLEELARERIFDPLGMSRTSYFWQERFDDNHAVPHDEFGRPRRLDRRDRADAAGSMFTTAGDYARFLEALLAAEGERAETVNAMWSLQVPITTRGMFGPASRQQTDEHDEIRLGWSLGWGRFETDHGPAVFHTGHDFGWQNYTVTHVEAGTGVVLLSNSNNFEGVARELVAAALGPDGSPFDWLGYPRFDPDIFRQPPPDEIVVEVPREVLASYAGDWEFLQDRLLSLRLDRDRLLARSGGEWREVAATSPTELFIPGTDTSFRFSPRPGRPPGLTVLMRDLEFVARPVADALEIPPLAVD